MSVDIYGLSDDNKDNEHNDDDVVIKLDELTPINDPDCKHYFVKDEDEIGEYQAWICRSCSRGAFYPKGVEIINS